jgi:hypothetical protein
VDATGTATLGTHSRSDGELRQVRWGVGCAPKAEGGRLRTGLSRSGQADLQWRFEHLLAYFTGTSIDEITIADVDGFRLAKVREGKLGATSINKMIATLAAILETAVEHELIHRNPAKGSVVPPSCPPVLADWARSASASWRRRSRRAASAPNASTTRKRRR